MPNSHRPPDTTRQSCLCRVWHGNVNWAIAINVFILQIFSRRQSWVVGNPSHTAEADATQTRQFCRVRPASLAIRWSDGAGSAKAVEARVDVEATDRWLHAVDNAPDLQSAVSDHRHRVVVVAEVLGVGQLVRMRRRRRLGQVTFPARQHLVHRRHDRRIVQLDLPTEHVTLLTQYVFGALTLSVGRQEEHPACKNWVMRCWCGYLSGARCRLFAYGPADATASPNPIISCLIQTIFTFLVPAYPGTPEKEAVKRLLLLLLLLL